MSDSNRGPHLGLGLINALGIVGVIVIWSLLIWSLATQYHDRTKSAEQQARYAQSNPYKEADNPCAAILTFSDLFACVKHQITAYRETQRAEQDLAAQQSMADWALWIVLISGAQAILSFGGLYMLILNLSEARATTRAAIDSASAAREANAINESTTKVAQEANDIARLEQRSYMDFRLIGVSRLSHYTSTEPDDDDRVQRFLTCAPQIEVKNFGRSPAIKVALVGRVYTRQPARDIVHQNILEARRIQFAGSSIVPPDNEWVKGEFGVVEDFIDGGRLFDLNREISGRVSIAVALTYEQPGSTNVSMTIRYFNGSVRGQLFDDPAAWQEFKEIPWKAEHT